MPLPKTTAGDAGDDILLRKIGGVGPTTLCALANCGYSFTPKSTLGDFKKATGSFADLQRRMSESGIAGGYTLPKLKALWGENSRKRSATDQPAPSSKRLRTAIDVKDPDSNFLLEPKADAPAGEIEDEDRLGELPETESLARKTDVKAMPLGDIVGKVEMSVIPDVTLTVSPDDKGISAPSEVMDTDPVPIIPGVSIGPVHASVRHVAPQSLEEKQEDQLTAVDLPSVKANGTKDLGGDGYGALASEGRVGKDQPISDSLGEEEETKDSGVIIPDGNRKFTSKALSVASIPKFDESSSHEPIYDTRSASRHPFKQASLFRNHDVAMKASKMIDRTRFEQDRKLAAANQALSSRDLSWFRYNDATQGVAMAQMPIGSSNYLMRGPMVPDHQLFGTSSLKPIFGPSPYINEQISGRFH